MKSNFFYVFIAVFLMFSSLAVAQGSSKIIIEKADSFDRNQIELPDVALITGNIRAVHDGVVLLCNKAYLFEKENYLKAFGNVQMIQGDTLTLNSEYAEYNGETKMAFASGKVSMRSPDMSLTTDTVYFDRNKQQAWYNSYGTIINKENVLKSKSGRYFVAQKKFQFLTAVVLTNPEYVLKSNHLDYFNNSGRSYLFGPSTITSGTSFIYTEKGFYDSKKNTGYFLRRSYIKYKDRLIEGDSLWYNRNTEFASASRNVKITDSINRGIVKGHYAEVYRQKDSMFVTKRGVAVNFVDNDSVYIHGQRLMVTGKPENRIVRAFKNARFYKTDLSGKCDSIHSSQVTNLTKLIGKPILWNFENQLTGDIMYLKGNDQTQKLDSLIVLNKAFIISKDTIGTGFNQVKGQNLYGKFKDNQLYEVDIVKNTEVIYYMRDDDQSLIGINKGVASKIRLEMEDSAITTLTMFNKPDSFIYPEKDLPENARKLRGFVWRGDERIKSKDDIFPPEENEINDKLVKEGKAEMALDNKPIEIGAETIDYDNQQKKEVKAPKKKSALGSKKK